MKIEKFLNKLTENGREYIKRYNLIDDVVFKIDGGTKFLKVKYFETRVNNDYENDNNDDNDNETVDDFVSDITKLMERKGLSVEKDTKKYTLFDDAAENE